MESAVLLDAHCRARNSVKLGCKVCFIGRLRRHWFAMTGPLSSQLEALSGTMPEASRDFRVVQIADKHLIVALLPEPHVSPRQEARVFGGVIFFHQMRILRGIVPAGGAFDDAAFGHVFRRREAV